MAPGAGWVGSGSVERRRRSGSGRCSLRGVRVFIISDMEGVAGVTKWEETTGGDPLHADRSRLYTEEINAAVRGAFTGARPRSS